MAFINNWSASRFLNQGIKSKKFLDVMDKTIPWDWCVEKIDTYYKVTRPELGWRPRIETEKKLRMYFLSAWFNLSDIATEEAIYDRLSFQYFMNIDVTVDQIPDSTTLCEFRNFLESNELWKEILQIINDELKKAWLILSWGMLVDATIIKAPSSTKNIDKKRDPEMSSTQKSWNRFFWAKVHIATDTNWVVQWLQVTTAKVHDSNIYEEFIQEDTTHTVADAWYTGEPLKKIAEAKWIVHTAMKKRKRNQKVLSIADRLRNTLISMPRKVVEFPFGVIKHLWGHRKLRYRWLEKLKNQRFVLAGLCNMYRMRTKYLSWRFW